MIKILKESRQQSECFMIARNGHAIDVNKYWDEGYDEMHFYVRPDDNDMALQTIWFLRDYPDTYPEKFHKEIERMNEEYDVCDDFTVDDLKLLGYIIDTYFIKMRIGNAFYYDVEQDDCIYFRIYSDDFNWYNVIWDFVQQNYKKYKIDDITVEKRISGKWVVYRAKDGTEYNHMPIKEFLSEEHENNPCFEKKKNKARR